MQQAVGWGVAGVCTGYPHPPLTPSSFLLLSTQTSSDLTQAVPNAQATDAAGATNAAGSVAVTVWLSITGQKDGPKGC